MANGASGFYDLLTLILCCGLLNAATQPPRERVVYVTQPVVYGEHVGAAHAAATGGDLPMLACASMARDGAGEERV